MKRGGYQFFEINEENEKRHFKKMRVSQNCGRGWSLEISPPPSLKIGKNWCSWEGPARKSLIDKALIDKALSGRGEVKKFLVKFPNKINILGVL